MYILRKILSVAGVLMLVLLTRSTVIAENSGESLMCNATLTPGRIEGGSSATIKGIISFGMLWQIDWMGFFPPKEIVLENSPGGYVAPARELATSGYPIRVTGERCASACAIILVESPRACLDETVQVINFHTIVSRYCMGESLVTEVATEDTKEFINKLRQPLRDKLGNLWRRESILPIPASEFLGVYPEKRCK